MVSWMVSLVWKTWKGFSLAIAMIACRLIVLITYSSSMLACFALQKRNRGEFQKNSPPKKDPAGVSSRLRITLHDISVPGSNSLWHVDAPFLLVLKLPSELENHGNCTQPKTLA